MRIIHVTNYFRHLHDHVGGAEQACYRTALLTAEKGWSVSIISLRPNAGRDTTFEARSVPVIEDYLPGGVKKYVEAAKWFALQYDPLAVRSFRSLLKNDAAEIVHFHNCQFLTLSLLEEAKKLGRRTVVSIYDYWLFCPTVMLLDASKQFCQRAHGPWCLECLPSKFSTIQRILLSRRRGVIDRYLDMVDTFHVLSEHSGRVLEGYGIDRERMHVVPLTLPMEYRTTSPATEEVDPNMILFAGWLNERKGLHRLLEAMPFVLKQCPDARLTAIGGRVRFGEEYEALLETTLDRNGIRDKVDFKGHLQPDETKSYVQKAAVVVIPEQYENMSPLLMIEAMTLEKPLVISRMGGIPEFVEDGVSGWLADPRDPRDFAEKIVRVLRNGHGMNQLGKRAREAIFEKCDDETVWRKTRAMYDGLLE